MKNNKIKINYDSLISQLEDLGFVVKNLDRTFYFDTNELNDFLPKEDNFFLITEYKLSVYSSILLDEKTAILDDVLTIKEELTDIYEEVILESKKIPKNKVKESIDIFLYNSFNLGVKFVLLNKNLHYKTEVREDSRIQDLFTGFYDYYNYIRDINQRKEYGNTEVKISYSYLTPIKKLYSKYKENETIVADFSFYKQGTQFTRVF